MSILARKKIVFVIVEGPSDEEALGIFFEQLFDKNKVFINIVHGDITTSKGISSNNIIASVENFIDKYF